MAAADKWPVDGWPADPPAWVYTVASRRALDSIRSERRRDAREATAQDEAAQRDEDELDRRAERWHSGIDDDRLRLIFTCCHPMLDLESRIALTLRSVAWLTTDEIATAFGVPSPTMGQRLVRAKRKIKDADLPYRVPIGHELPDRLAGVLRVVYLVFNEAYLSSRPTGALRVDLADEAIRLGRALAELMPDEPEVSGLLALMLVQHARSAARFDDGGDLVLLEDQDRSVWDREMIDEGADILQTAMRRRSIGPYQLQAAINALHGEAETFAATDWRQIAALYGVLAGLDPSPVIELNRAVAIGHADGADAGLRAIDALIQRLGDVRFPQPHLVHAARAEMLVRVGRSVDARVEFETALALATADAERRHLLRRLAATS